MNNDFRQNFLGSPDFPYFILKMNLGSSNNELQNFNQFLIVLLSREEVGGQMVLGVQVTVLVFFCNLCDSRISLSLDTNNNGFLREDDNRTYSSHGGGTGQNSINHLCHRGCVFGLGIQTVIVIRIPLFIFEDWIDWLWFLQYKRIYDSQTKITITLRAD
ncbi:hypothetical protein Glove_151g127 [Diversispora epigaea]|uniref:Uncharacterized protein n=1 Tax=Diversispora epigaea TaxID=1348612 RepID=A0A397IT45_9GLOM|nr:hypothetical protein Glove_151g127 [Diversispora epigaea]